MRVKNPKTEDLKCKNRNKATGKCTSDINKIGVSN